MTLKPEATPTLTNPRTDTALNTAIDPWVPALVVLCYVRGPEGIIVALAEQLS
jgi:hypothetical protein